MMKVEKVTTVLQVNKTQEQLDFVNIGTSGADNRLFLDPLLLAKIQWTSFSSLKTLMKIECQIYSPVFSSNY